MQPSETMPVFVDLNVLPKELRPRRYQSLFVMGLLALLAASLLLIPLYQAEQAAGDETARLQAELDFINVDLTQVQADLGTVRGLQQELETAKMELADLNGQRQVFLAAGKRLSRNLSSAVYGLPAGAGLTSVVADDGQITLAGRARNAGDVFRYATTLEAARGFSEARVTSLVAEDDDAGDSSVTFTVTAVR